MKMSFNVVFFFIVGIATLGCRPSKKPIEMGNASAPKGRSPLRNSPRPMQKIRCFENSYAKGLAYISQAKLDRMDCLCHQGRGRCCVTLAGFVSARHRIRGKLTYKRAEKSAERYYDLGYKHGSGLAYLESYDLPRKTKWSRTGWAFAQAEKRCKAGDTDACDVLAEKYRSGCLGNCPRFKDKRRARQFDVRGCRLGDSSSCRNLGEAYAVTDTEKLRYLQIACETGPPGIIMEQNCIKTAVEQIEAAYPETGLRELVARKDYPVICFDALVVMCSVRYGGWLEFGLCKKISNLCRKTGFKSKNKAKYCPKVAKQESRYLAVKKAGKKWDPQLEKTGYLLPSCKRWKAQHSGRRP